MMGVHKRSHPLLVKGRNRDLHSCAAGSKTPLETSPCEQMGEGIEVDASEGDRARQFRLNGLYLL
jgi:hypothetical protein